MQRIPSALELTVGQQLSLRDIVARSFVPASHVGRQTQARLLELGLVQLAMGGLMATPAGRILARL